jgi:hypothetical protein
MRTNLTYTSRQGEFLAFIHHYTTLHGRPPAEADMVNFFQVTPPSVHQMILTLERRGLITRAPGQPRSIALRLPPQELPPLHGRSANTSIPPPAPAHQAEGEQSTNTEAALLRLGKIQLEDWFAYNDRKLLDDSEFVSILDLLIESFADAGLGAPLVQHLRRYGCELYHRFCQRAVPETTFEANMQLMFRYLPASGRARWRASTDMIAHLAPALRVARRTE